MEVLLPARPTLLQITMNSGQNIKNNYLKVLENEKQADYEGRWRVNSWKKVTTLDKCPLFMAFG